MAFSLRLHGLAELGLVAMEGDRVQNEGRAGSNLACQHPFGIVILRGIHFVSQKGFLGDICAF